MVRSGPNGDSRTAPGGDTLYLPAERANRQTIEAESARVGSSGLLNAMLDGLPGPAVVLNEFRQIVGANKPLLDQLGGAVLEDVIGQRPGEALCCDAVAEAPSACGTGKRCRECGLINAVVRSLKSEKTESGECRLTSIDGQALDLEVRATQTVIDDLPVVFVALRDISGQKRREVLEVTFLHDLLNTAGGLQGLLSMAEDWGRGSADKAIHESLLTLSQSLVSEIRSYRQLNAAESGELELSTSKVDLTDLLTELRNENGFKALREGRLVDLGPTPDVCVETDPTLLRRILSNMLKNALEASKQGDTVTLWAEVEGQAVSFFVRNPGVIPRSVQRQIFQRSFSTKGVGRGVGTYSMKLLGEHYLQGKVSFLSEPPHGTTFSFQLPPSALHERRQSDRRGRKKQVKGPDAKVLLVDDIRVNRLIGRRQLEKLGCQVTEADEGQAALDALEREHFDMVFLDVQMPEMGGREVVRVLRKREKGTGQHTPVVALTGSAQGDEREHCLVVGMDEVLEKPADASDLASMLKRFCLPWTERVA